MVYFRAKIGQKGPTFEEFFNYAVDYRTSWQKRGFDTPLLNRIIFKKIQRSFGGQLKVMFIYFEKAARISKFFSEVLSSVKRSMEISLYFCGLLRICEL